MKTGRCFMSLRKGHLIRLCRSKQRCNVCGGKHPSSICTSSGQTESATTELNPASPPHSNLRPPIIKLFNPEEPNRSIEVRVILDTGSQQSYATKRVKDALALKCLEKRTMSVMTFGASTKKTQTYDIVRIRILTRYGQEQDMEFVCAPLICQPYTAQQSGLNLADSHHGENKPMEVDLLIGSDYYWWFATGETRGRPCSCAYKTWLGPLWITVNGRRVFNGSYYTCSED